MPDARTGQPTSTRTSGHRTGTPGIGHRTPDTGRRTPNARTPDGWTLGTHRTPDTGRVDAGQADADRGPGRVTKARWASGHPGQHDAAGTPNRVVVGSTRGARQPRRLGGAVLLPARETACCTTRQVLGRSTGGQAAPRRTAVREGFRVERRAARWRPSGIRQRVGELVVG
jgi:hypothetical protein